MPNASEAVEAVRERALALRADGRLGIATDAETYAKGKKPAVLVALALPTGSLVLAIDSTEYDAEAIARLAGFLPTPPRMLHVKGA